MYFFTLNISNQSRVGHFRLDSALNSARFQSPVGIFFEPSTPDIYYILEQAGRVISFNNKTLEQKVFLDIRDKVTSGGETGLLGLAFHPDYKSNGRLFLDYTASNPLRTKVVEYDMNSAQPKEKVILEVNQPYSNHNGGAIVFGPDGYLYISLGDGGSGGDPHNNAQNLKVLLGKILRINVDAGTPYTIPNDNPFYGNKDGYREEIFAYGLRNVWKFTFDGSVIWAGDVGQGKYEEVDIITAGGNYGWNIMEGNHCFLASSCNQTGLIPPVAEYNHDHGQSITGGYVYRGKISEINGQYIYADYVTGKIWGLQKHQNSTYSSSLLFDSPFLVSSFGLTPAGELLVVDHQGFIYIMKK